eukprot:7378981-Prymnesium_polylepis.1
MFVVVDWRPGALRAPHTLGCSHRAPRARTGFSAPGGLREPFSTPSESCKDMVRFGMRKATSQPAAEPPAVHEAPPPTTVEWDREPGFKLGAILMTGHLRPSMRLVIFDQ